MAMVPQGGTIARRSEVLTPGSWIWPLGGFFNALVHLKSISLKGPTA